MSQDIQKNSGQGRSLKVTVAIMAVVTFFAPAHAQVAEWGSSIIAMTWQWQLSRWGDYFYFHPLMILQSLPFTFLRPIFLAMFYRLYKEKSSRKRVLIVGILSEILVELIYYIPMLLSMIMYPWGIMFPLLFPIPLLLVIGLVYMKFVPPPEVSSWVDDTEPEYWWTQKEEKHDEKPAAIQDKKPEETSEELPEEQESDVWMD